MGLELHANFKVPINAVCMQQRQCRCKDRGHCLQWASIAELHGCKEQEEPNMESGRAIWIGPSFGTNDLGWTRFH